MKPVYATLIVGKLFGPVNGVYGRQNVSSIKISLMQEVKIFGVHTLVCDAIRLKAGDDGVLVRQLSP